MKLDKAVKRICIAKPKKFRIADHAPAETYGATKDAAETLLADDVGRLADLQQRLWAQDRWAVLVILQGMDAAGKDGVVKHVMAGINPQGCDVHSFKAPTPEELNHDFLWRTACKLPERGRIGIFNRSYYEEVLVARVHPDVLAQQRLPKKLVTSDIWRQRFKDIVHFERMLAHNGVLVLKFFLHISPQEQRERLLARLEEPAKRWKFSMNDVVERKRWPQYMAAYEEMIRATSHADAPWHVVPADHKPFAHLMVARVMIDALSGLDLAFPEVKGKALAELKKVERALRSERGLK
ncbi:MAG TPA: polyphosphate kinase 2 family protein [Xanthobacteraceae bacterium]|nr:polyphosphate kinase 2 family protein [Xanthobacteraceae bacterium]